MSKEKKMTRIAPFAKKHNTKLTYGIVILTIVAMIVLTSVAANPFVGAAAGVALAFTMMKAIRALNSFVAKVN